MLILFVLLLAKCVQGEGIISLAIEMSQLFSKSFITFYGNLADGKVEVMAIQSKILSSKFYITWQSSDFQEAKVENGFDSLNVVLDNDEVDISRISRFKYHHMEPWLLPLSVNLSLVKLRLDSLIFTYNFTTEDLIEIAEHYSLKNTNLISQSIGYFSIEKKKFVQRMAISDIWSRRGNLNGAHFNFGALPMNTFVKLNERNEYSGSSVDILTNIASISNFTFDISPPPDGQFGVKRTLFTLQQVTANLANVLESCAFVFNRSAIVQLVFNMVKIA